MENKNSRKRLMCDVAPHVEHTAPKVSVVGAGQVGVACAYSMMIQGVASEIAMVDVDAQKLKGEVMDLQQGQACVKRVIVRGDTDFAVTKNSHVCIMTAGARQKPGESRLCLVQRNVEIYRGIISSLVKHSPDCILVIVSNPVDILTYVAWKLSGFPAHRVIGSGTMLDSARFRYLMSEKFDVAASSCHAWIIGEHGDTSVPVWSGVNIAGVPIKSINPEIGTTDDKEAWVDVHKQVVNSAYEIIRLKGYTSWAIGLMVASLTQSILRNQRNVFAVSTNVKGHYGIETDMFLSLPCVIGENGASNIIHLANLSDAELHQLRRSADTLYAVIKDIKL